MEQIAWRLLGGGHLLEVYKIDPATRRLVLILPLRRTKPMSFEEASKYVNDNYPRDGSAVRVAAETLEQAVRKAR